MQDPYRASPMLGGLIICLGGVLLVICSYFLYDDVFDKPDEVDTLLILAGVGYGLWVLGSVLLARARFSSLWAGFFCGLLLLPGLILLTTAVRTRSRQQIWREANPSLTERAQKRQYRDLKSLY